MKKISIKELAKIAGVSVATVSRVINNNGRFSEETRDKILKLIEITGYQTNYTAKSLRTNKSYSIGILVPDISNFFFADVVQKIEEILFKKGYSTIICNTARDTDKENAYIKMLESKIIDGLILISGNEKFNTENINFNEKIPYICIDREPVGSKNTVFISSDHYTGAFQATHKLLDSGVKNPLFIRYSRKSASSKERKRGFKNALKNNGIKFNAKIHEFKIKTDFTDPKEQLIKFLKLNPQVDGIFALNDNIALEVINILHTLEKKIPEEIKIIGFDDIPAANYCNPALSTVRQNTDRISFLAVEALLNLINSSGEKLKKNCIVPVEIVIRSSL